MRMDDDMMRVAVLHKDGSIRGVFVAITNCDAIVVTNIVCDISPDKVKPLTAAIAKIGMTVDVKPVITWTSSLASGDSDSQTGMVMQSATYAGPPATPAPAPAAPRAAAKAVPKPATNTAPKTATKAAAPAAVTK